MESLGDAEVFYARPSVSAEAFCQALASTAHSLQEAPWQPCQQLDCLLELEACLQVLPQGVPALVLSRRSCCGA